MNCPEIADLAPLYRSGELESAQAAAFSGHLARCEKCARALRADQQMDDRMRAAVLGDAVDTTRIDREVRQRLTAEVSGNGHSRAVEPAALRPPVWRVAAIGAFAAALLLAVGVRHLTGPHGVYAAAAADHRSEVVNAHWRPWLTDPAQIAALAERSGVAPRVVAALAPPGYHLARAKRCALDGRPFLHLVYSDGSREFSAYLRPRDTQPPLAIPTMELRGDLETADFGAEHLGCVQSAGLTAMIVTDESAPAATDLARFAVTALAPVPASNF